MKKILAVALTLALTLTAFAACAESKETLTMATNASFPPYEYVEGDQVVGIDPEIAAAVCEKMGYDLEIVDTEFDSLISDFVMAGMTVTEERKQMVSFSDTYATGVQVIIVKDDSPITSVDDLLADGANYTVGTQNATTGYIYAMSDIEDAGKGTVAAFPNGNEAVMALVNGKIDCVIIDNEPAKAYVAANEGLKILDSTYVVEDYAACFAKDNTELVEKFNAALEELTADGTIPAIIEKYIPAE